MLGVSMMGSALKQKSKIDRVITCYMTYSSQIMSQAEKPLKGCNQILY